MLNDGKLVLNTKVEPVDTRRTEFASSQIIINFRSIATRKQEPKNASFKVVQIPMWTLDKFKIISVSIELFFSNKIFFLLTMSQGLIFIMVKNEIN